LVGLGKVRDGERINETGVYEAEIFPFAWGERTLIFVALQIMANIFFDRRGECEDGRF
jgi:hypothetical protein